MWRVRGVARCSFFLLWPPFLRWVHRSRVKCGRGSFSRRPVDLMQPFREREPLCQRPSGGTVCLPPVNTCCLQNKAEPETEEKLKSLSAPAAVCTARGAVGVFVGEWAAGTAGGGGRAGRGMRAVMGARPEGAPGASGWSWLGLCDMGATGLLDLLDQVIGGP